MGSADTSHVLELRQYACQPGQRDALIALFDRELLSTQDAVGMRVLGQFRDLDDPDRFVWMRGFPDLPSRVTALEAFYGGPVWQAHRAAANATMIDSDNVLLLRPLDASDAFVLPARDAAPAADDGSLVVATVYLLAAPVDDDFTRWFTAVLSPLLAESGAPPLARLVTEYGKNEFPRLPVREGEHAFVWLTSFASVADHSRHRAALAAALVERPEVAGELARRCVAAPQTLRLAPTARSLLRHRAPAGFTLARRGDVHDFDFLAGAWDIANRRLVARGVGATTWDEFPSSMRAQLHLGGVVNVDEIPCPARGWTGMTVRHFRRADHQWSIRWISSLTGAMDPELVGGFHGDRGEFYGHDHDAGRPVAVRFLWTRLGPDAARWEQAFSYDGGAWETNWVMAFRRTA